MPHILLIEDNEHQRRIIRERLQIEGYQVTDTPFGDEGIKLATTQHPDLIIIDIMVPHMDGWQVMKALQADASTKDIPYVVLSGAKGSPQDIEHSMALGAQAHFAKGVTPMDEMLLEIRLMIGLRKVLILDANYERAKQIRDMLQSHRFLASVLNFGMDAVNRVQRMKPDLIMISNQVSGMPVSVVLQRVRQIPNGDRIPVLFITDGDMPQMSSKGATEMQKLVYPCTEEQLLETVGKILDPPG
jgi:CheY-like chemotaxis protein